MMDHHATLDRKALRKYPALFTEHVRVPRQLEVPKGANLPLYTPIFMGIRLDRGVMAPDYSPSPLRSRLDDRLDVDLRRRRKPGY